MNIGRTVRVFRAEPVVGVLPEPDDLPEVRTVEERVDDLVPPQREPAPVGR